MATSPEFNKELLSAIDTDLLLSELQKRVLSADQVEDLHTIFQLKEKGIKAKQIAGESQSSTTSAETHSSSELEAQKWADIIRDKGIGTFSGMVGESWQIAGKPIIEYFESRHARRTGYVMIGNFGLQKLQYSDSWRYQNSSFLPKTGLGSIHAFLAVEPNPKPPTNDKLASMYEFQYFMPELNSELDRRGGIQASFIFRLPPEEGMVYLEAATKNPDLIEATFQKIYPGLTGEQQLRRPLTRQIDFVHVSRTGTFGKENKKVEKLQFSRPVGEVAIKS